jgi:hypothetical protein
MISSGIPGTVCTRRILLAAAIALTAGCGTGPFSPDESRALQQAEARWATAGLHHYTIEMRRLCFCPVETTEWATVEVRDGAVIAATLLSGEPVPEALWTLRPPVPELFAQLRAPPPDWVRDVAAAYDPVTGLPTEIRFVSDEGIADAGWTLEARDLLPLE